MQGLLHWLLASPFRMGLAAAALALSRLFDVFGAALLSFAALRKGWSGGLRVLAVAMPLVLIAGYASGAGASLLLAVLALWLPVFVLSLVLRESGSLALMLQAGWALTTVVVAGWFWTAAAPLEGVRAFLESQVLPLLATIEGAPGSLDEARLQSLARLAPGLMAAGSLVVSALTVLIGRWWQAIAFNPGGFRRDFHRLRHGRSAAVIAATMVMFALTVGHPVALSIAISGMTVLVFQGIALAHGLVAAARQPAIWLWGMYGLLFLLPLPATVLLAAAGGIDNWMDFRRLAGQDAGNSNEMRDRKGE